MISQAYIQQWRSSQAPWVSDAFVEHDLILSQALVEIFSHEYLMNNIALRGGTALNKLFLKKYIRFSEDIDLVQIKSGDNGPIIDAIRSKIDPILGFPKRKIGEGLTTLTYRFIATDNTPLKLKVEMNTREHQSFNPLTKHKFTVNSNWFSGECAIISYTIEEILGTKLRALYQRKKGRDLFDFWALSQEKQIDYVEVAKIFSYYIQKEGLKISRKDFEENLLQKSKDKNFLNDIFPLLVPGVNYDSNIAYNWLINKVLIHIV